MSDISELHQRDAKKAHFKPEPMKDLQITREDTGKVFVLRKGEEKGGLVTREVFLKIPVAEIQTWEVVTEFDVNTWD